MRYKILAVDDNPINLKLISTSLVNSTYEIVSASSGQDALDMLPRENPDLVLLDIMMPGLDGFEVCRRIKNMDGFSELPVIFLTAMNESIDKARGLALGAVDYVTKPFDPLELNARVRTHLLIRQTIKRLAQKNEELEQKVNELKAGTVSGEPGHPAHARIDKFNRVNFYLADARFEMAAATKAPHNPATSKVYPVVNNYAQCLYLIVNGFEKQYNTLMVELMLEKYCDGYFHNQDRQISSEDVQGLVNDIMDHFSPDTYNVAFTFSLGLVDKIKNRHELYAVHQPLPFIYEPGGQLFSYHGHALEFKSDYKEIISARTMDLSPGAVLCHYQNGKTAPGKKTDTRFFLNVFQNNNHELKDSLNQLQHALPKSDADQIIALLRLK